MSSQLLLYAQLPSSLYNCFQRYTIIDAEARKKMKELTRFDDIAGAHEAKVEMKEIVDYLKRPQAYTVSLHLCSFLE